MTTQRTIRYAIDLPFPISANRLWRATHGVRLKGRFYKSAAYKEWIEVAGGLWLAQKQPGPVITLGSYEIEVVLDAARRHGNADGDNLLKCINDFLQSMRIVHNDKFCERWGGAWGHAPVGCHVEIVGEPYEG